MKKYHITFRSNVLTDLCLTKQRIKTENTFAKVVYSVLVVKMFWQNIRKFVWALMVQNLQDKKKEQFSSKIISNRYQFHLKFMLILNVI